MKRGRHALLILLGCGLVACVLWVAWDREPSYEGRTVSEWALIYRQTSYSNGVVYPSPSVVAAQKEALEAVWHMREGVIRRAIVLIGRDRSSWRARLKSRMESLQVRRWCPARLWIPLYFEPSFEGLFYFGMLGTNGAPAIPALEQLVRTTRSRETAVRAVKALGATGPQALPALTRLAVATNLSRQVKVESLDRVSFFDTNAAPWIAKLSCCFSDMDPVVRRKAAMTLGELGLEPRVSVQALLRLLSDPEAPVREKAAWAIGAFGSEARDAVGGLVQALCDPDAEVRRQATYALQKIAPEVVTNGVAR